MTELGSPYPDSQATAKQLRPRISATIWLTTTLLFSLLPFGILPLIYHAFHQPHRWPSVYNLFGHGDLALVVVAVLGAIIAELVLPSRTSEAMRAILVAISAVCGMTAVTVYSVAQYQVLAQERADTEVNTVVLITILVLTVAIQCFFIIKRQLGGDQ
jgi:hypothetical protein